MSLAAVVVARVHGVVLVDVGLRSLAFLRLIALPAPVWAAAWVGPQLWCAYPV